MPERARRLRDERTETDRRTLDISLNDDGDLRIDGWDFGRAVDRSLGSREYEWTITIRSAEVPKLVGHLGGREGEDVLEIVARSFVRDPACVTGSYLKKVGIACEVWSRTGD